MTITVRGVSNKHCLLPFFIELKLHVFCFVVAIFDLVQVLLQDVEAIFQLPRLVTAAGNL